MSLELTLLVKAAQEGDPEAFDQLVNRTRVRLRAIVGGKGVGHAADDLVQDTYLQAWRDIGKLRDPRRFTSWLMRIAVGRAMEWWRRREVEEAALPKLATEEAYDFKFNDGDYSDPVLHALNFLDFESRMILHLRHSGELSTEEIAATLNLTPAAVRKRDSRAAGQLRRRLKSMEDRHEP